MPYKILLAEDDPFLIDIYSTKFKSVGFDLSLAESGDQVLAKLKESKPDLLLLDIVLPGISGWEALAEIKKDPQFNSLKVIVLSNLGQRSEVEKGIEMGADGYLIKAHYTPTQIVEEINKILDKKAE
ncbi:MAG: response regulator [Candidatus Paceibacterota bacterium]|jgi:CheY-like chemotaxis protein|nr:response regulator [Candidatus Paceibacterota bacterium]MDD4831134.1 response regulator [Candidatus Paceibacterota bacterium]MDD4875112.1 response regulator [Candidatus Paceibacterota bacterium]